MSATKASYVKSEKIFKNSQKSENAEKDQLVYLANLAYVKNIQILSC